MGDRPGSDRPGSDRPGSLQTKLHRGIMAPPLIMLAVVLFANPAFTETTWHVRVKTGDMMFASTSDKNAKLTFIGENYTKTDEYTLFGQGNYDRYTTRSYNITTRDILPLTYIRLRFRPWYTGASWYLDWITVENTKTKSLYKFNYYRWFEEYTRLVKAPDSATCGIGYFGRLDNLCNKKCHCVSSKKCDRYTGQCPYGCSSEWTGPYCQTPKRRHGTRCSEQYECDTGLICNSDNMCTCYYPENDYYHEYYANCQPRIPHGGRCDTAPHGCDIGLRCHHDTCSCYDPHNQYFNEHSDQCEDNRIPYGSSCEYAQNGCVMGLECRNNSCDCDDPTKQYYDEIYSTCNDRIPHGGICLNAQNGCATGLTCRNHECACIDPTDIVYYGICYPISKIGGEDEEETDNNTATVYTTSTTTPFYMPARVTSQPLLVRQTTERLPVRQTTERLPVRQTTESLQAVNHLGPTIRALAGLSANLPEKRSIMESFETTTTTL